MANWLSKLPFNCEKCTNRFSNKYRLQIHNELIHSNGKFECRICKYKSKNLAVIIRHNITHRQQKLSTSRKFNCYKNNAYRKLPYQEPDNYPQSTLKNSITHLINYPRLLRNFSASTTHPVKRYSHRCTICNVLSVTIKRLNSKSILENTFNTQDNFSDVHKIGSSKGKHSITFQLNNTHDELPYNNVKKCIICGKGPFKGEQGLCLHLSRTHNIPPRSQNKECKICGKGPFKGIRGLVIHLSKSHILPKQTMHKSSIQDNVILKLNNTEHDLQSKLQTIHLKAPDFIKKETLNISKAYYNIMIKPDNGLKYLLKAPECNEQLI